MTKKLLNLGKWYQKEKNTFLERENFFSSTFSSESAKSRYKNPEEVFSTKGPTFFYLKLRRRLKHCAIFQKLLNLRIFERYAGCSFDNHAGKKFR